ncbi:MAG: hypothetical protein LBV15_01965 [Planctomycetota bacterium]|jgi:hypothetical protein|nr:hypothetical protein [Planctomycetota bacterium]
MDSFLEKLDALAAMAEHRAPPAPLDAAGVIAKIRLLDPPEEAFPVPLGFFAGGVAAAAALALLASWAAAAAWAELSSPMPALGSLMDVMDVML